MTRPEIVWLGAFLTRSSIGAIVTPGPFEHDAVQLAADNSVDDDDDDYTYRLGHVEG